MSFRFFAMHDMNQAQYFATAVRPYAFWLFEWAVSLTPLLYIQQLCSTCGLQCVRNAWLT